MNIKRRIYSAFSDNPLDKESVEETVYLNIINNAKDYVYITTLVFDY